MQNIVLATATRFADNDQVRPQLALATTTRALASGLTVSILDGGSPTSFLTTATHAGAHVRRQQQKGFGNSIREGFEAALKLAPSVVCWLQFEKQGFVRHVEDCCAPILEGRADIVIPARKSMESYPKYQKDIEGFINAEITHRLGVAHDYAFGVVAATPNIIRKYALTYVSDWKDKSGNPTDGKWDVLHFWQYQAMRNGHRVMRVDVDYTHSPEQRSMEENDPDFERRREQLMNLALPTDRAKALGIL